ncbi:hypothetical protein K7W42_10690 [Deinococcus sp. HMF7604]|uniref:hypothetical protein n=1 Tax=Deinococcus betulae TaxID=2873312 RepID=UPI001CCB00E1|nr:hypothetical protein [Deinococcus betulae]MBZ9751332.1 hypothetical protein [Deinococcus betulae]
MTQRVPSERALQAVQAAGMTEPPLSALERDDALFALTAATLLYQDGAGTRRVTLRDLTRIHSDQEGLLRVETPAGTALTASLLGFDPAGVQAFFGQVRDATARAKEQPTTPLPQAGGAKTFAPKSVTSAAQVAPTPAPVRPAPPEPAPTLSKAPQPEPAASPKTAPVPAVAPADPAPAERPATPVVISSSGFSPSRTEPRPATTAAPTTEPVPSPGLLLRGSAGAAAALFRQAEVVAGLTGRLRVLGALLFLGAVALAFFQFQAGERLGGLWTLLAGGVGTIALMALADLARLLALLARASGEGAGVMDVE